MRLPRAHGPRFPFAPLEAFISARLDEHNPSGAWANRDALALARMYHQGSVRPQTPLLAIARELGVSRDVVRSYRTRGLSPWQADRLATRVGLHPAELWPTWADWVPETPAEIAERQRNERNERRRRRYRERQR